MIVRPRHEKPRSPWIVRGIGIAVLALVAVGGVALILWLDKTTPDAPPPAPTAPAAAVYEPKEGAVVAVVDHDGRVFFLHATFADDPTCEPKCYSSELRELGVRGGTKLGNAGGEPTTLAASDTHAIWGRSGLWDLQPLAGGERKPLAGGERAALDATHAYFAGRELSRVALDTGKSETLVSGASAVDVGIDDLSVYYLEPGARTLWRMLKQGGARTPIAKELDGIVRLSVGKGRVYVAARGKPPSTQGRIWDIAADGTDKKELATFEGAPVSMDSASGKVDWVVYEPGAQAVLYTAVAGSPARELRRFDAPVLKGSGASKRELAPDVASTERFVYVTSAAGLLQIERR